MMKILLTAEVNEELAKELDDIAEVTHEGWGRIQEILSEEEMIRFGEDKDIIITSYDPITKNVIDHCPNLKLVICTRANPVNVDAEYCKEKGILVSYAPGRNSDCTAEYTVALMLSITRMIPMAYMALKNGQHCADAPYQKEIPSGLRRDITWALGKGTPYVEFKGFQMHGHNLGVIGYGSIGRRVAELCKAFGMNILVYDPFLDASKVPSDVTLMSLDELLANADIVTVHCKDTPETENLINAETLKKMKKTAYLINTSRGALVDEEALVHALLTHEIAGAAVDVYQIEPIARNHPFITQCDNIVITPHLAGATYDAIDNHTVWLVEDVKHFLKGEPMERLYNV